MGRILCIDYGRKRCGIAVTDSLQICANGLPTVRTCDLQEFLKDYIPREGVEEIVVGDPRDLMGNPSESARYIAPFLKKLASDFPGLHISRMDERFTSSIAHREMIAGGFSKSQRREKERADQMAAVLILTSYLESKAFRKGLTDENSTK